MLARFLHAESKASTILAKMFEKFDRRGRKIKFLTGYSLLSTGKCKISDSPEEKILRRVEIELFTMSSVSIKTIQI